MPLGFRPLGSGPLGSGSLSALDTLFLGDATLDFGLSRLNIDADRVYICSQKPTTYNEAITTYMLGYNDFGASRAFNSMVAGTPSGRSISSVAILNGTVANNGIAKWWAAIDSSQSRLLAAGKFDDHSVTAGQQFSLSQIVITLLGTP